MRGEHQSCSLRGNPVRESLRSSSAGAVQKPPFPALCLQLEMDERLLAPTCVGASRTLLTRASFGVVQTCFNFSISVVVENDAVRLYDTD